MSQRSSPTRKRQGEPQAASLTEACGKVVDETWIPCGQADTENFFRHDPGGKDGGCTV
jgi:hypothetical protein